MGQMIQIFSEFQAIRNVDTIDEDFLGFEILLEQKTAGLVKNPKKRAR